MKKLLAITICFSLVLGAISPAYAINISTGAAIRSNDLSSDFAPLTLSSVGGSASLNAAGDSSDPYYVSPTSSSYNSYYYTGNQVIRLTWGTLTNWGSIISLLTESFANSIQGLKVSITPYIDQLEGYVDGLEGLFTTSNNYISDIRSYLNYGGISIGSDVYNINETLTDMESDLSDIHEVLTTTGGISVDFGNSFAYPWGYYNYYKTNKNVSLARINSNGNYYAQSVYTNNLDYFGFMQYWFVEHVRNMANAFPLVVGGVKASANTDKLTNSDLSTTDLEHDSLWDDLDHIGSNLSSHLARLAFVLASDEDIAAREAAASNQDSAVDYFIDSSGSGSVSTTDLGDMASISSGLKDGLSTGVSPSAAFGAFSNSSSAWDWFTNDTANALDTTNSRIRAFNSTGSSTPYLDDYYSSLSEALKVFSR